MKPLILFFALVLISITVFANKTSVKIDVVKSAKKGSEVTVTIHVSHSANSPYHFTDWVYLKINGKEVKRWTYDKGHLPPAADFTLIYKFNSDEVSTIEVMGDCNLHGSAGAAKAKIDIG